MRIGKKTRIYHIEKMDRNKFEIFPLSASFVLPRWVCDSPLWLSKTQDFFCFTEKEIKTKRKIDGLLTHCCSGYACTL